MKFIKNGQNVLAFAKTENRKAIIVLKYNEDFQLLRSAMIELFCEILKDWNWRPNTVLQEGLVKIKFKEKENGTKD